MIKNLSPKIKLPNYDLGIQFIVPPPEVEEIMKKEDSTLGKYGEFDLTNYSITIVQTNKEFDYYSYIMFLCGALMFCQDLKVSNCRLSSLSFFLYYLFTHNDIKTKCKEMLKGKEIEFDLKLPVFDSHVSIKKDYELPGCMSVSEQIIKISNKISNQVKPVIFIHELVEWADSVFSLQLSHATIQSFAEVLAFVIMNNDFVS